MSTAQLLVLAQYIRCSGRRSPDPTHSSASSTIITNSRVVKLRIQITRSLMYEFLKSPPPPTLTTLTPPDQLASGCAVFSAQSVWSDE